MTAKRHAISIPVMLSAAKHPVTLHQQQDFTGSFRFQRQDDKVEDDEHQDDGKTSGNLDSRHAEAQPKHPVIFHIQDFTGSFTLKGFRMTVMQTITGSFRFQRQDDKVEDDEHQDDGQMHIVN
ncbi:hypothetical protein SAMN06298224_1274 [Fibrobacter sp. UWB16]|uniref:hypothetical protein n=1 Tax=Fibrobacter sp. UWB16 TaxID=1945874 RepID=UPI000BD5E11B|nr:hypothetical protein [Fibrobacter sp. UWB16]SOD13551.1 hypothetical protein SAMN06298224_1274 [Fibrobacter sp. UWB16]